MAFDIKISSRTAHQTRKLIVHNLNQQLAWLNGRQNVLAQSFFFYIVCKRFGNFIVNVGIQQGAAYIFQCFSNINLGDAALAFQYLKRPFQPFTQIIKHEFCPIILAQR